jgi:hypothetical protein
MLLASFPITRYLFRLFDFLLTENSFFNAFYSLFLFLVCRVHLYKKTASRTLQKKGTAADIILRGSPEFFAD